MKTTGDESGLQVSGSKSLDTDQLRQIVSESALKRSKKPLPHFAPKKLKFATTPEIKDFTSIPHL